MINGSLPEVFGSFAIGVFFTLLMTYLIHEILQFYYCKQRNHEVKGFFSILQNFKNSSRAIEAFTILIISILIYSTGVLIEDLTDHLTDSDRKIPFQGKFPEYLLLPTEGELRYKTLVNDNSLNYLGKQYFRDDILLTKIKENYGDDKPLIKFIIGDLLLKNYEYDKPLIQSINENKEEISEDSIKKAVVSIVNAMYYDAKNWCYSQHTHFQELELIQNRVDFSRSSYLIALFFHFWFIVLLLWGLKNKFVLKLRKRKIDPKDYNVQVAFNNWMLQKHFICLTTLIIILFVSYHSYEIAELNFNERAFGYYLVK